MKVVAGSGEARVGSRAASANRFLARHDFLIPLFFFLAFLAFTLPGISWGAPGIWHPDEVVLRSIKALHGDWDYYEANFNHPFLPQNVMVLAGSGVMGTGGGDREVLITARVLSAVLLGAVVALAYFITRRMGAGIFTAGLSSLALLVTSEVMHNGHFAHTDAYVTFFSTLTVFFLVRYNAGDKRGWLYAAFLGAGLAVSSKYNGLLLLLAPFIVYAVKRRGDFHKGKLAFFEPLFMGVVLSILGFGIGTPKFLTWMSYFMKRAVPAFIYNGSYGYQPGSFRGFITQYGVLADGVGLPIFLLFAAGTVWAVYRVIAAYRAKTGGESMRAILLLCILLLDQPIMLSYNVAVRFFLPMLPLMAVLGALFIRDLYAAAREKGRVVSVRLIGAGLALVLLLSLARTLSVMLVFVHDARYAAGEYLKTLPAGTSLEHTFYPPTIPGQFEREHNYPLHFIKSPGDVLPVSRNYVYNAGEAGLDERGTEYLVIDSFTLGRFDDPYTCATMQVECDFFGQLAAGGSAHYRLLADFRYVPPGFLPQVEVTFVNPEIWVYGRVK